MAVKAKAEITLSRIVDIASVTRYYLLQSSTATAPSKPTANPPGGSWTPIEPAYTSGTTNTLYFVDLTVFTNGTFSYSAVSKSSSYEAAKEAYNAAVNAQTSANDANRILADWCHANDATLINGAKIYTGTVTADKISVDSLESIVAKIGGFTIGASALYNGATSLAGASDSVYLGTDGISCGTDFLVTDGGKLTASDATITGVFRNETDGNVVEIFNGGVSAAQDGSHCDILGNYVVLYEADSEKYYRKTEIGNSSLRMCSVYVNNDIPTTLEVYEFLVAEGGYSNSAILRADVSIYGTLKIRNGEAFGNGIGSFFTDGSVWTGGKTSTSDGETGAVLSNNGRLFLQGPDGSNPYICFYKYGSTVDDAFISYYTKDDTLRFGGATRYVFGNILEATTLRTGGNLYINNEDDYSEGAYIYAPWKDGSNHAIASLNTDGLTAYFGWSGSSTYPTTAILRGRTVKYANSSGTTTLSDERLKKDFISLDRWDGVFDSLKPWAFKLKNGDSGRYHFGFGAHEFEQALLDNGLTTQDCAALVRMQYQPDEDDPEGNAVFEEAGIKPGDYYYGIIYTELTTWNIDQTQKLKHRVKRIEEELRLTDAS